jgi:hypothetical protein
LRPGLLLVLIHPTTEKYGILGSSSPREVFELAALGDATMLAWWHHVGGEGQDSAQIIRGRLRGIRRTDGTVLTTIDHGRGTE